MQIELIEKFQIRGNMAGNSVIGNPSHVENCKIEFYRSGVNNKLIIHDGVMLRHCVFSFWGSNNIIEVKRNASIKGYFISQEGSSITIGERSKFNDVCRFQADEATSIQIGNDCLLASVKIRSSDAHAIYDLDGNDRINPAQDVLIEDNVWIADEVMILKGVVIGRGSIIAARSTVTKSLPAHSLCAGIPAKVVKERIRWTDNK